MEKQHQIQMAELEADKHTIQRERSQLRQQASFLRKIVHAQAQEEQALHQQHQDTVQRAQEEKIATGTKLAVNLYATPPPPSPLINPPTVGALAQSQSHRST